MCPRPQRPRVCFFRPVVGLYLQPATGVLVASGWSILAAVNAALSKNPRAITRQQAMVDAPATAPIDVPAPEIMKANAAPWLMSLPNTAVTQLAGIKLFKRNP